VLRYRLPLVLLTGLLFLVFPSFAVGDVSCLTEPAIPAVELVYSPQPGEDGVTAQTREKAVAILCARLRSSEVAGQVSLAKGGRVRVVLPPLPRAGDLKRLTDQLAAEGQIRFYDWEPNLIGPERTIGGHPGSEPPVRPLRRLQREWATSARRVSPPANRRLILAGAFPSPYGAVRLASKQAPRASCRACTASGPRFYLFDRSPEHKLIAGPVAHRAELRRKPGTPRGGGLVLKVPVGTLIASEPPTTRWGVILKSGAPGWFALRDRSALTNADIVRPAAEQDEFGQPNVTFGFTPKGRVAFERVTRAIARRGRKRARGKVTEAQAEALSGHFAVVYDGEVKVRPIINFFYNPFGIDGRTGAEISGGFTSEQEARDLAAILGADPLPIELMLFRQRKLTD
jgi:SecD/SecF fusion protein